MGRKKKIDKIESANKWKPFNPDIDIPKPLAEIGPTIYSEIISRPYTITTTTLGDSMTDSYIIPPYSSTTTIPHFDWMTSVQADSTKERLYDWEESLKLQGKEEELKVNVISRKSEKDNEYIVFCRDILDLSTERILTTLSATKGRLMFDIAPVHVKEVECKMTPSVKKNIIEASKKLKMYGKKTPIIPSFDEYGNRLPDQLEIGDDRGITVKIVDPEEYGECYLELKATEFPTGDYVYKSAFDDMLLGEDSPF